MNSSLYYSTYVADSGMSDLNHRTLDEIRKYNPSSVLEFGSGTGKNLHPISSKTMTAVGVDISMMNVINAHCRFDLPYLIKGNETLLKHLHNFDVVFTVSVLDHIEQIDDIISHFKRIANKAVILAETQHHDPENHYYFHDYSQYGFKNIAYEYTSEKPYGDGNIYHIWLWRKGYYMSESGNSFVTDDLA